MRDAAVEDEDVSNGWPKAAAIPAMATSRPATRILTPRFKAAWRCQDVRGFRYAGDMCRHLASKHPCVDR
jgi:hypothetical protein